MGQSIQNKPKSQMDSLPGDRGKLPLLTPPTMAIFAVALSCFLVAVWSPWSRQWMQDAMGYGWILMALCVALGCGFFFQPHPFTATNRRYWVGSAGIVAIQFGILSFFPLQGDTFLEGTLGGSVGVVLTGPPLALGIIKLAAIIAGVPLAMFPVRVGFVYWRILRQILAILQARVCSIIMRTRCISAKLALHVRRSAAHKFKSAQQTGFLSCGPRTVQSGCPDDEAGTLLDWPDISQSVTAHIEHISNPCPGEQILATISDLNDPDTGQDQVQYLDNISASIETELAEHGIGVKVVDVKTGPTTVRFGLKPGWSAASSEGQGRTDPNRKPQRSRATVQSILKREKDLALALRTPWIRIEAPVPGEAIVGLEIPNPCPRTVTLTDAISAKAYDSINSTFGLPIALGLDTIGTPVVADLSALPHLMIAGATGSGKSVCVNSIVASLLWAKTPAELQLLMIDPKRVELTQWDGIPHLSAPIFVEIDDFKTALEKLVAEMFIRLDILRKSKSRSLLAHNEKARNTLPYIVVIVDELADLMIMGGPEIEQSLVRLAQLGRATGIHLVLATQRPSVNVVTGLLKANIPARIAFAVASQIDSRVILDTAGAERLLGRGDMLLLTPESAKPRRVQGAFVGDGEMERLVGFWAFQKSPFWVAPSKRKDPIRPKALELG